ncbi:MAG: T9SS type A sorting domain-containing protein [Muribaculaceae bacterium]|nr:T9SS type A sorting domain-containing protein [Muribaculaceae bacterium]
MKRQLLLSFALAAAVAANAGTMRLSTSATPGTNVKILLNAQSATSPVSIDWGNGVEVKYTVDPSQPAYNRWISGTIEGPLMKVTGNLTEVDMNNIGLTSVQIEGMSTLRSLDLANNEITSFELLSTTPLTNVNLSYNNLINSTYDATTLSLEYAGETLTNLNVSHNDGLICLDIRDLMALEYLTANDCPQMGSVFICMPEDSRTALYNINLSNCDLAHFYPVSLPNLHVLNLSNNQLMTAADTDPFVLGNYPSLTTLDVSDNRNIEELDVTGCKKLSSLSISNNGFERIDLSQCPELEVFNAANNNISSLDLGNNPIIRTLNISGNPITELDVTQFPSMRSLNISNTKISRVMLMQASFLEEFIAANTLLEFVDFNGQQAQRMRNIDLRNNAKMTGRTVDYTIHTLPEAKGTSSGTNLWLEGSNAETADIQYATSIDMKWVCDIQGDGTANHDNVNVTLKDATDTGENKTGVVDRLYPIFGMSMEYDFDIYETDGGKFLISQWQPLYYQKMNSVTDKALAGVPIHIYPYPEEGKRFKSVTVNGEEIKSQWFVVEKDAEIKVNFTSLENAFVFKTVPGNAISMLVNTKEYNGTVSVDWGTGNRTEYTGMNKYETGYAELKGTRIDGTAAGDGTITIYGDVEAIDLSGFGEYGLAMGLWDNQVSSVNFENAPEMKYINLYWNPVTELNLAGAESLEVLNIGYTAIKNLDLSNCPNLMWLDAHSDGFGDEPGITMLSEIDLTKLPILQYVDLRGNEISKIDLTQNSYLRWANLNNNELSSIDVTHNPLLQELNVSGNNLTSIDLSKNTELEDLSVSNNKLTSIDLSANKNLATLYVDNNDIHSLNLKALTGLRRVYINGNGMTAEELNDVYYLLPTRLHGPDDEQPNQLNWNLAVIQATDRNENEGTRADSSIAEDRGWTPSHLGTNGGAANSYLDIYTSAHGSATVKDENGNVYTHGSKVPKYAKLTIEATPDQGYEMKHFTLNGEEARTGNEFDMPGIYTKLRVEFGKESGVDNILADAGITVVENGVIVTSDNATVDIYSADGKCVINSATVNGSEFFSLTSGVYIVRKAENGKQSAVKAIIR